MRFKSNEEKAREIVKGVIRDRGCVDMVTDQAIYNGAMTMAEWKNKQFEDYLNSVLYIKILYFLNEKEKRENTIIDKMDWRKTAKEFADYLKQQEENS